MKDTTVNTVAAANAAVLQSPTETNSQAEVLKAYILPPEDMGQNGDGSATPTQAQAVAKPRRFPIIDNVRGIVILLTVLINFVTYIPATPRWFYHAPEGVNGIYFADIGVVAFTFVLTIMYSYNFNRKLKTTRKGVVYKSYFIKALALIGLGFCSSFFEHNFQQSFSEIGRFVIYWNVLVTYGFITMIGLIFMKMKRPLRIGIGFFLILLHQFVIMEIPMLNESVLLNDQGGLLGLIPWTGLLLLGSCLGDYYFEDKRKFYLYSFLLILVGALFAVLNFVLRDTEGFRFFFANKRAVSAGYILITLAIVVALFLLCDLSKYIREKSIPFVSWMGQSSVFFFLYGAIVRLIVLAILGDDIFFSGTGWDVLWSILLYGVFMFFPAYFFHKKGIMVKL